METVTPKYGIKIHNFEAGSIYGVNAGVRDKYDMTDAMLTNSLFTDFILANGLNVYKEKSTWDIIGIEFNYGTTSYEEEIKKLNRLIGESEDEKRIKYFESLLEAANTNKEKFDKKSADQIREIFYTEGVDIYYSRKSKSEKIHYKMLYRTPGKAKKGSCMFIRKELYDIAHEFLTMGIKLPEHNAPIVEIGAYSSLVASTIIDRVQINPKDILILKDVESSMWTTACCIETDENKHCKAVRRDNYEIKNVMFDGQALIDTSIFPEWADGYVLLRQHFFKAAAFATHIQKYFRDYFGDKYDTATVTDMWGNEHLAKDIKMITTDNACKFLKFDQGTYDYWCERVHDNGCLFGIVKTAHPSKLGEVQRMSYQMVNALDENTVDQVLATSIEYVEELKSNTQVFIDYLRKNINFSNDFEVLIALYEQDHTFEQSEYFRERKKKIIQTYVLNLKTGKVLQDADNLTIVGSPYAMLMHSVGENPLEDPTFEEEDGTIQCWTGRFKHKEYLAEFRNPFNSFNNLGHLHNMYHEYFDKYFDFGDLVIAVNMNHTDFEDRNNGSDMDSDSIFVTRNEAIVNHAEFCYTHYPTVVNLIPKDANHYDNVLLDYAKIDNQLSASQRDIGESSNLAQLCLTYGHTFNDHKYDDYSNILAVIAQASIDSSKRRYDINISEEIKRIKQEINVKENGYPIFWMGIRRDFNRNRINYALKCPMNYLYKLKLNKFKSSSPTLPMSEYFVRHSLDMNRNVSKRIERLIEKYSLDVYNVTTKEDTESQDYLLLRANFEELVRDIRECTLSNKYIGLMSWLIDRAFMMNDKYQHKNNAPSSKTGKNKVLLLKTLYEVNPEALLKCFAKNVKYSETRTYIN